MTDTLRILSKRQVKEITTLSYTHTDRLEAQGKFPKRIRLSHHPRGRCGWLMTEIGDWVKAKAEGRKT